MNIDDRPFSLHFAPLCTTGYITFAAKIKNPARLAGFQKINTVNPYSLPNRGYGINLQPPFVGGCCYTWVARADNKE
jgi:hypothetical protein